MSTKMRALSVCAVALTGGIASADVIETLTFDDMVHGQIVNTQYTTSHGVTISAENFNRDFDLAVAFDTTRRDTRDSDLEDPWRVGNLARDTILGRALIIQENNYGTDDGIANRPDDEGNRPAGTLTFAYDRVMTGFGFDVIDLESTTAEMSSLDFILEGAIVRSVDFSSFLPWGAYGDPTIEYGDNSANRIRLLTADELAIDGFDTVRINVGGSMAFDNIRAVPTPGTMAMLGLGGVCLARRRRSA